MIFLIPFVLISTECECHINSSTKISISDREENDALSNTQIDTDLIKLRSFLNNNKSFDGSQKYNSINRKKVTTKTLRSGQTAELICEINECENPFKVSWSFRSRTIRKRKHIGNFYLNGLNARYLSRVHNISVEWNESDGFSKLSIPDVRKDLEGSYYCTVKAIERNCSCLSMQKFATKIKERCKAPISKINGSFKNPIYYPNLTHIATIANDTKAHLRDPSTPIFDPKDSLWHFWASRVPVKEGSDGYPGRIYHYYSLSLNSTFKTSGIAIDVSPNPGNFDSYGTFTPSAFLDKSDGRWTIFYGGVTNSSQNHTEDIGIAISKNGAFGPFVKSSLNPVITWNDFTWCSQSNIRQLGNPSTPARVDEAEPYILNGQRVILVKTVCQNFTALPMMFASSSNDHFKPPFKLISDVPIINASVTAKQKVLSKQEYILGRMDICI